jgi:hypothetical protein
MLDPEDEQLWPTLDFLANKAKEDDERMKRRALANKSSAPIVPATTSGGKLTKKNNTSPIKATSSQKTNGLQDDIVPKPNSNISVQVAAPSSSSSASKQKLVAGEKAGQNGSKGGTTGDTPTSKAIINLRPKASFSEGTPNSTKTSASISSRAMSRTSSISHAEWCKSHSPRRSTLKPFVSPEKAAQKGVAFVPGAYEGNRNGYIHRSGLLGTGYYLNTDAIRHARQQYAGASKQAPQLHPSLQGMGLSLKGYGLSTVIDDSETDTDNDTNLGTYQSQRDMYDRVLENEQAVNTLSPQYRKQHGMGIYGPEDADWLTRRLAEQYRQEQIGHGETLAASLHKSPTTRGKNSLWNTVQKREENNLSYYERLHQTTISGSTSRDSKIAGSWFAVLKSKSLDRFLPHDDDSTDDSSSASSRAAAARMEPRPERSMGHETDWMRTPTHGVTGKHEFQSLKPQKWGIKGTQNAKALHKALQKDSKDPRFGWNYITHQTGMARACKGSNSVWNTSIAKSSKNKVNRILRNPKPDRLVQGLDRNRYILKTFLEAETKRDSPQQRWE